MHNTYNRVAIGKAVIINPYNHIAIENAHMKLPSSFVSILSHAPIKSMDLVGSF